MKRKDEKLKNARESTYKETGGGGIFGDMEPLRNEVSETIRYLIANREALRSKTLCRLEKESQSLMVALEKTRSAELREEIACFRDILSLHRRLISNKREETPER